VNAVTIQNLTGAFFLDPDFPVTTPLVFQNASITVLTDATSDVVALGDIGPGVFSPSILEFSSDIQILSLTFSATLSPTLFDVSGTGQQEAASPNLVLAVTPTAGDFLEPGVDFGILTITTADTAVPEPASWLFTGGPLLCGWRRISRKGLR
jgi:hypothetical protein